MAFHTAVGANTIRPRRQNLQTTRLPAPAAGVDTRAPAAQMSPDNCLYSFNMVGGEYGMKLRLGFQEWALNCESEADLGDGVYTVMAYNGDVLGVISDRLFAVTREGIWDVTNRDSPPTQKCIFLDTSSGAGYGVYTHYTDASGDDYLYYADEVNGLWMFSGTTGDWTVPEAITGVTVANVAFVTVHKQRLWMIEKNSTTAWYLPVASLAGAATAFHFGAKFPHGGILKGLYNWTVDGGKGVDDYLVAISDSGDVIPYQGEDPSTAESWSGVGTYFIGATPKGRRFVGEYTGNLYILSSFGLIAMSDLLRGVNIAEADEVHSIAHKIALPIREAMANTKDEYGWEPKFLPGQGILLINQPHYPTNTPHKQWVQNLSTQAWGAWRGVPIACAEDWHGNVYFGDANNGVQVMDGHRDKVLLDDQAPGHEGVPIEFSILTSYQDYGAPTQFKIGQMVRPDFYSPSKPSFATKILYDYQIQEANIPYIKGENLPLGEWDTALWDYAIWNAGSADGISRISGSAGMGRVMAIAIRGESQDLLRLLSCDVMWTAGGVV